MKRKRILALFLAAVSCLLLAVSASAANTVNRKATDFRDFDKSAWYAEAVSAAVDNGLLYGKSATIIDPNGDMTRAEMAAIINRSFGCYVKADISKYKDVSKDKWYFEDVAMAVQMGTYNGRSNTAMAPDAPISRQEAMTVVARALDLDYDAYAKTDLSAFSDRSEISNWALPYVRAMVGADYIHGRTKGLEPLDNITRAEFAQISNRTKQRKIYTKDAIKRDDIIKLFPILEAEHKDKEIDLLWKIAKTPQALRGAINLFSNAYDNEDYSYKGLIAMMKFMDMQI